MSIVKLIAQAYTTAILLLCATIPVFAQRADTLARFTVGGMKTIHDMEGK